MIKALKQLLVVAVVAAVPALALPEPATATPCIGLHCGGPIAPSYVPEAHGVLGSAAGLEELVNHKQSGFYEIPAPAYYGDVQPLAVVYLSRPGELGRMHRASGIFAW